MFCVCVRAGEIEWRKERKKVIYLPSLCHYLRLYSQIVQDYCDMVLTSDNSNTCKKTCPNTTLPITNPIWNVPVMNLATNLCFMTQINKLQNKSAYGCHFSCRWLSLLCWPSLTDIRALCPASSSIIRPKVHLKMGVKTFCLQLSTATELVVTVGCVNIAGDRSSTWWSLETLWEVLNIVAI